MIRINLLPIRQTQKRQTVQQQLLLGLGLVVVTLIGCIVWAAMVSSAVEKRRQEITRKQNELKQLDKIIGEVNEFTAKKKEYEEKLKVIDDLKRSKSGPVRALDDLAAEIPNRVWLTRVVEKNRAVTVEGRAIDHEDVSAFMKSLQKSKYFGGIVLSYSKANADPQTGETLYEFKITCSVNYSA